jgi:hypothetical protein
MFEFLGNTQNWLKVCIGSLILCVITYTIFIIYFLNPCDAQEDTTNCRDGVATALTIPLIFYNIFLFTGIIGTCVYFIQKIFGKSPNTQSGGNAKYKNYI